MLSLVEWIGEEMERIINLRILMEKRTADSNNNDDDDDTNNNAQPQELLPIIIKSIDPRQMRYLVTDPKLRYILKLAEFQLPQDSNQDCIYPITASLRNLTEITELVKLYQFTPVEFENGKKANEFLRVHSLERGLRERYANDDEEINEFLAVSDNESEEFFENAELRDVDEFGEASNDRDNDDDELRRNGLKKGVAKAKGRLVKREASEKKKSRKRRERHEALPMHELSDDEDHVRAPKKEVRAGFASSKYIVDSDDESDEENDREFFAREQKLRDFINLNGGVLTNDKLNEFLRSMADGKGATEGIEQSNKRDASKTLESPVTKRAKVRVVEDDQSNAELSSNDVNEPESGLSSDDEIEDKKNAEILKISTTRKARIIDDDEDDYDGLSDNEFQNSPASKSNTPLTDNEEVGDVQTNAKAVEYKNTGPLKIANDDEEEEVPTKRHKPKIIFDDDDDDDE
jgi:replication fork protection complex subunit Tof1/Swi1